MPSPKPPPDFSQAVRPFTSLFYTGFLEEVLGNCKHPGTARRCLTNGTMEDFIQPTVLSHHDCHQATSLQARP